MPKKKVVGFFVMYGACLGLMVALMSWARYRYTVIDHAFEIYGLIIGILFITVGIWLGLKLSKPKTIIKTETIVRTEKVLVEIPSPVPVAPALQLQPYTDYTDSGISQREAEVLQFLARGLSNQEIADQLFVSQNTVKTHLSNLYFKLDVKRRTQAVEKARALGIIG